MPGTRTSSPAIPWRDALKALEARGSAMFARVATSPWAMPVAAAIAIGAFLIALAGFDRLDRSFENVSTARAITIESRELRLALLDAETGQRGFALTGDEQYLKPYTLAAARLPQIRAELARLTAGDIEGRALFQDVGANLDRLFAHWAITIEMVKKGDPLRAQAVIQGGRGKEVMDELREDVERLERLHESRFAKFQEGWRVSFLVVAGVVICVILLVLALFLLLLRYSARTIEAERRHTAYAEGERERLERAVRDRTLELSELASYLQQVQESERLNVARELHDEMGALLTASKMNIAWLLRQKETLSPAIRDKLQKLDGFLEQGVQLKRKVIEGLAPSALSNLGLNSALEALIAQASSTAGIRMTFTGPDNALEPPQEVGIACYRAAQEALTNVQRHAKATEVSVELDCTPQWIGLRIQDNGQGFRYVGAAKTHGLRGMRHRAVSLGGTCVIQSAPGQGTTISFRVPFSPRAPE
jgi:signal transduction histidine kinase